MVLQIIMENEHFGWVEYCLGEEGNRMSIGDEK
jgi:hypothetical protein